LTPCWLVIAIAITDYFIGNLVFFVNKSFEDWKNVQPLVYCNFSKKGFVKSTILDYFKKKFFDDLFIFEDWTKRRRIFWKTWFLILDGQKLVFSAYSNFSAVLIFFSANYSGFEFRAQKSIRIAIPMLQEQ
jgi:hypothetical protein